MQPYKEKPLEKKPCSIRLNLQHDNDRKHTAKTTIQDLGTSIRMSVRGLVKA